MGTVVDCPVAISIFTQYGDSEYWMFGVMRPSFLERRKAAESWIDSKAPSILARLRRMHRWGSPSKLATWDFEHNRDLSSVTCGPNYTMAHLSKSEHFCPLVDGSVAMPCCKHRAFGLVSERNSACSVVVLDVGGVP